jgi:Xaa-Pro aminopeptidase
MTIEAVHARRRQRVLELLGATHGALVIAAAPELRVGSDGEVRYVPDADLYYLTGYTEPDAVLVLCPSADSPFTLFVRDRDPERERWSGTRSGVVGALEQFAADAAHPVAELGQHLAQLVEGANTLYAPLQSGRADIDAAVLNVLASARRTRVRTGRGPHTVTDPRRLLSPLRLRKDAHEIGLMREAARITVGAFEAAAGVLAAATGEWQVEAAVEHAFRREGALGAAFPTIVAAGENATVLHYTSNSATLGSHDMLLVDAGARYRMYCADITRTWPVAGRFSGVQRAAYEVVLHAHAAAVAAIAPGQPVSSLHEAALHVLVDGMIDLGLAAGTRDEALETGSWRNYFPHRTSHWLGLDVHDVGDYVSDDGTPATLEPGMVLTVEPGLYVPAGDETAPAALRGLGIRLEDDVLVTGGSAEVLTARLAIRPDEVEALLGR